MPIPATEDAADTFSESDWKELIAAVDPSGEDVHSVGAGESTLIGKIPANKARSALNFFVGYSYSATLSVPEGGVTLYRVNPVRHPVWTWMRCTSATFHRRHPLSNPATGVPSNAPNVPNPEGDSLTKTGNYLTAYVRLHFAPVPWDVVDDADMGGANESTRNTVVWDQSEPNLETISANTGTLHFVEGAPSGKTFPGDVLAYLTKTGLVMRWLNVSEEFTHDGGYPVKILERVGTTNIDDFFGFPRGTLLMLPPRVKRYQQPVRTVDGSALMANDWELVFQHFDPEPGVGYGNSIYRGHQLLPWAYGGSQTGGPGWFSVEREDDSLYLPESKFDKIFEGWAV